MISLVMHSISSPCTSHLFVPRCFICSKEPGKLTNIQILYFKRISLQILFSGLVQCIFSGRNRRILTLIEFYWKSSFPEPPLLCPLKQTQFQCIFTTHSPKARQGKPFFGHICVDFNKYSYEKQFSLTKCRILVFAVENLLNCLDPLLKSSWQIRQAEK